MKKLRVLAAATALAGLLLAPAAAEIVPKKEPGSVAGKSPVFSYDAPPPKISFDVYEPDANGSLNTPWPLKGSSQGVDEGDVPITIATDGKRYYNVGSVTMQLTGVSSSDIDSRPAGSNLSAKQLASLKWLERNAIPVGPGALIWQNTAPLPFDDIYVKSPWQSSYSQADVIKALLFAYSVTHDKRVLELARRAGYAFDVPCEQSGLDCVVEGLHWYEEVPLPNGMAPLILNGHLYAVIELYRLYDATHDRRILKLARRGALSAKQRILEYDTGYWTIYQMRPITSTLTFDMLAASPIDIQSVRLDQSWSDGQSIDFSSKDRSGLSGGGWGTKTERGVSLSSEGAISLKTGTLKRLDGMSVIPESRLTVSFHSPTCDAPRVGLIDVRDGLHGFVALNVVEKSADAGECKAVYLIRRSDQTWTTLDRFYMSWHTRALAEVAKRSKDPTLTVTAFRWNNYIRDFDELAKRKTGAALREKKFDPVPDPALDAAVTKALASIDILKSSPEDQRRAIEQWASTKRVPKGEVDRMLNRIGLPTEKMPDAG